MTREDGDRGWITAIDTPERQAALAPAPSSTAPPLDFAQVAGICGTPLAVTDANGIVQWINAAFEQACGAAAGALVGRPLDTVQAQPRRGGPPPQLWTDLAIHGYWRGRVELHRRAAPATPAQAEIRALLDASGNSTHFVCTYHLEPAVRARRQARVDPLTGLLDRQGLIDAANRLCAQRKALTLLTLDIDGFTAINEHLGWVAGDRLLQAVGQRCSMLVTLAGATTLLGRVGADEFALLFAGTGRHAPGAHIRALQLGLEAEFEVPGAAPLALAFSFGRCELPAEADDVQAALIHATAARQDGPITQDNVSHYARYRGECDLLRELREAVARHRLAIAWQPQFDLAGGRPCGAEALVRWTRTDGTEIPPGAFIPVAENDGLITHIDDQVLDLALRDLAGWRAQGIGPDRVAVNMSAAQLQRPGIAQRVQDALARHGVSPCMLDIEITESVLLCHMPSIVETLRELHALGIVLSIDDFGTGYSSLAYLRELPIDRVKIDRSFVADMTQHATSREIVRAVVGLAQRVGLRVVAEGIECREQQALLARMGCHEGQGFLLGRPMAAGDFLAWLRAQ